MNTPITGIRASDAEREQISKLLQTAAGEGRLTPDEAGDRLAEAQSAKFRHELERLVADLPPAERAQRGPGRTMPRAFWVAGAVLRATAFLGFLLLFWRFAFWPMAFLGMFAFFAFARVMRYRWYARRQWWSMRRSPDRWVTVVR